MVRRSNTKAAGSRSDINSISNVGCVGAQRVAGSRSRRANESAGLLIFRLRTSKRSHCTGDSARGSDDAGNVKYRGSDLNEFFVVAGGGKVFTNAKRGPSGSS